MAFLIADSGATKTDWLYVDGRQFSRFQTQGLYPSFVTPESDLEKVKAAIGHLSPKTIFFFGTGCGYPKSDSTLHSFLKLIFPQAVIRIQSDLQGAGIAFFGKGSGIAAVLGTGSVCAKIEKGKITNRSAPLGFAIGDEGSAADLGKRILKMYYRNRAEEETLAFISEKLQDADYGTMINRIYGKEKPNRELASIAGQVLQPPFPAELNDVIKDAVTDFIRYQLTALEYDGVGPVVFTGKVAHVHQRLLLSILKRSGFENSTVKYPVISAFEEGIKTGKLTLY